jgi:glycosyltransferase involved in cell wall biosynthesis
LFVDQFAEMGGGQRILLDVLRHLASHGHECAVALPYEGVIADIVRGEGHEVYFYPLPAMTAGKKSLLDALRFFPASQKAGQALAGLAAEFGAQLLYVNGPRCLLGAVQAARKTDIPLIAMVHLIFQGKEKLLLNYCFKQPEVKAVTFCSSYAEAPFKDLGPKGMVVPNWVSPRFQEAPPVPGAKRNFELEPTQIAVGVLGRISPNKGQRLFLEALTPLLSEFSSLRLLVAGGADFEASGEEEALHQMVAQAPCSYRVKFLGAVQNPAALLDALDILVVPSLWEEPFGLVAVEGMARGLPVVATKSGGLNEIVEHGHTGFLVEKTAESVRHAVNALLKDPIKCKEMGEAGRERVRKHFGAGRRLDTIREIVESALRS